MYKRNGRPPGWRPPARWTGVARTARFASADLLDPALARQLAKALQVRLDLLQRRAINVTAPVADVALDVPAWLPLVPAVPPVVPLPVAAPGGRAARRSGRPGGRRAAGRGAVAHRLLHQIGNGVEVLLERLAGRRSASCRSFPACSTSWPACRTCPGCPSRSSTDPRGRHAGAMPDDAAVNRTRRSRRGTRARRGAVVRGPGRLAERAQVLPELHELAADGGRHVIRSSARRPDRTGFRAARRAAAAHIASEDTRQLLLHILIPVVPIGVRGHERVEALMIWMTPFRASPCSCDASGSLVRSISACLACTSSWLAAASSRPCAPGCDDWSSLRLRRLRRLGLLSLSAPVEHQSRRRPGWRR